MQEVPGSNPGAAPATLEPISPIPRLQVAKMCQGSQKGWCTRKPSTRDDQKKPCHLVCFCLQAHQAARAQPHLPREQGGRGGGPRRHREEQEVKSPTRNFPHLITTKYFYAHISRRQESNKNASVKYRSK